MKRRSIREPQILMYLREFGIEGATTKELSPLLGIIDDTHTGTLMLKLSKTGLCYYTKEKMDGFITRGNNRLRYRWFISDLRAIYKPDHLPF